MTYKINYVETAGNLIMAQIMHHIINRQQGEPVNDFKMRCEQVLKALIEGELTNPAEENGL